ncbi:PAP1-domain-containing protein [Xylariaceae sp. FL1019]|nr:PAP1-domain-containing protein [Xylariaceae sp. FL1019]
MASTRPNVLPNFILTPQQQNLLFRALTSNQPDNQNAGANKSVAPSGDAVATPPVQLQKTGGFDPSHLPDNFLDYDFDLADSSFDFDFGNDSQLVEPGQTDLTGGSPAESENTKDGSKASSPENDSPDKRSHPDDDEDDDAEEGGGKRRESEGKVPKKPGRKPLTIEPSSKRKAQNRAAQRAFRERKEKHLKDLEDKVEELEKASAATNNENSQLRTQMEKMTSELEQYKKRLALVSSATRFTSGSSSRVRGFGTAAIQNINDVNFQFEFPKFGMLPGSTPANTTKQKTPYSPPSLDNSPSSQVSTTEQSKGTAKSRESSDTQGIVNFSSILNNVSPLDGLPRNSSDTAPFSLAGTNTGSPSSSSNSAMGPSSSCGTSPEPFTQSPLGFKPLETLTTIGEEQQPATTSDHNSAFANLNSLDFTNFDWLSQQNGGHFDPQLFGDYREPQENVLGNSTFDDGFFNDAFDIDFTAPFNAPALTSPKPAPKKDICAEIDARKETEDTIVPAANGKLLTCNNIWEQLQGCPRVQAGDLDLDGLCSDLQKKAKCGGSGAVVDEQDFKAVMTKYLGKDSENCKFSSS